MSIGLTAKRYARKLSSVYFLGLIPVVHVLAILVEMGLSARLTFKFNAQYARRPIITMMVTNAILGGIADTVAQTITAYRGRLRAADAVSQDVELNEKSLDGKNPAAQRFPLPVLNAQRSLFDFERLARFVTYGFVMAPLQFRWFKLLEKTFPLAKNSAFVPALKRVAFDQLAFAPFGVVCFFAFMTLAEGGRREAIQRKFQDLYFPTLKANYMVWPAIQIINFRWMPVQFQLPFVSTISIAWTAYLSLTNSNGDAEADGLQPQIQLQ